MSDCPDHYYNRFLASAQWHSATDLTNFDNEDVLRGFKRVYTMLGRSLPNCPRHCCASGISPA
jgi:hypothetical protein